MKNFQFPYGKWIYGVSIPVRELIHTNSIPVRELNHTNSIPVRELTHTNSIPVRELDPNFHIFAPSGPILKIFAFLKMALKFVGTFCSA